MSSLAQVAQSLQQHASEEPENTADDDKSAPESMQLDDAPNVQAPQPADKPSATQEKAVEDGPQNARTRLLERVMTNCALTNDQKLEWVEELNLAWEKPTTVSSIKSTSRSSPPEPFHGKPTNHGQTANIQQPFVVHLKLAER